MKTAGGKSCTRSDPPGTGGVRCFEREALAILDGEAARILASVEVIKSTRDPEGPHQFRVGLRRWRTAVGALKLGRVFRDLNELANVARGLGQKAGELRDLDVVAAKFVEPAARSDPDDASLRSLMAEFRERQAAARAALLVVLEQEEAHWFLRTVRLGFGEQTRLTGLDEVPTEFISVAIQALERRWRVCCKLARDFSELAAHDLHELRKSIKKLRYLVEFTEPYLISGRQTEFFACLKKLQEALGDINDATVAEAVLVSIGPPGVHSRPHDNAAYRMLQSDLEGARDILLRTEVIWQELVAREPMWRA